MRLSYIVEAPSDRVLANWQQKLNTIQPAAWNAWGSENETQEQIAERHKQSNYAYETTRAAVLFHAKQFDGKRWPALEKVLLDSKNEHLIVRYLNAITETWPEGQQCLTSDKGCGYYGANEPTLQYFLKHNIEAPHVLKHYDEHQSPVALRRLFARRLQELEKELQDELAKPPPAPKPVAVAGALDDEDEFGWDRWKLTIKQLRNRIEIVKQYIAMPDAQLKTIDASKLSRATQEALHLPWYQPSLSAYIAKYRS